jgi:hypothetical protein
VSIRKRTWYIVDSETIGTEPYYFKPEDGDSLFLRNIGVTYIFVWRQKPEDYSLSNPRGENLDNGTVTLCLLAAIVPLRKRAYVLSCGVRLGEISSRTADQPSAVIL